MENCEKHSKKICAYCKHYDYCDRVNRCDGRCYVCGINEFEKHELQGANDQQNQNRNRFVGIVQRLQFAGARFFPYRPVCLFLLEQIEESLRKQGFDLNGIDAELFVQDIDGLPNGCADWNYINPKKLLKHSKRAAFSKANISIPSSVPFWKSAPLKSLQSASNGSATTGTMKSISTRAMTGKITAKNCLKTANGGWTTTLSTTSTSRLTQSERS